ncbi:MAG: outer membrane beta-barrel protein [Rhizobiales bacterium]|nr:outer membrane beta-barrel protein [Hyphomicrobiales bacterium]
MRKFLLSGTVLCTVIGAGSAMAADIPAPVYKEPMLAPPVFTWAGFYIGANAGYAWSGSNSVNMTGTDTGGGGLGSALAGGGIPASIGLSADGFIGGIQLGYNWQFGQWVYGLETDIQWVDGEDSATVRTNVPAFFPIRTSVSRELSWLGTLRARLGVTFTPTVLAYVTGGLAYGEHELALSVVAPAAAPPMNSRATSRETLVGWTVGGGLEWALWENWSVKAEYLYYDLGDHDVTVGYAYGGNTSSLTARSDVTGHIVRAGLNYRF